MEFIGIDRTIANNPAKVASTVEWFNNIIPFQFTKTEYVTMIEKFKNQISIDKAKWEARNQHFLNSRSK